MRVTCPTLVGRDEEVAALLGGMERARGGSGDLWCLTGESGLGKTRLALEVAAAASAAGMRVHRGASREGAPAPYRPLAEALLGACPTALPDAAELDLFRAALAQVVPGWGQAASPAAPPIVVAEGIRRLLAHLPGHAGSLVVLEDLHWADAETLEVVDYLAGHLADTSTTILALGRHEPGSEWQRLTDRAERAGRLIRLAPLSGSDVATMVSAALGAADLPDALLDALAADGAGSPFLVEELLTAWRREGVLRHVDGTIEVTGPLPLRLPAAFAADISHRLSLLTPTAGRALLAAALTDLAVPVMDLAEHLALAPEEVHGGLDTAHRLGLLCEGPSGLAFTHELTREAVLAVAGAAERAAMARTLLDGARQANYEPHLLAELAIHADDRALACRALVEAGDRDRRRHALRSARTHLERVHRIATTPGDRARAGIALARTLLDSGLAEDAARVAEDLLDGLSERNEAWRVPALTIAARAALAGGDVLGAADHLACASALVPPGATPMAELALLGAAVALDQGELRRAESLAAEAVTRADVAGDPRIACEALELLGRVRRSVGVARARFAFTDMVGRAEAAGLDLLATRGLFQLGRLDLLDRMDVDRLQRVRHRAARSGALAMFAEASVETLAGLVGHGHHEQAAEMGQECVEAARVMGSPLVEARAWVLIGEMRAKEGDRPRMDQACAAALAVDASPETEARVLAHCHALYDLGLERRDLALGKLDQAAALHQGRPGLAPRPSHALGDLLRVVGGADPAAAESWGAMGQLCLGRRYLEFAEAVDAGRRGDVETARRTAAAADRSLAPTPWHRHLARRHVAEAMLADGWFDPGPWLREAADFFDASGNERVAGACRSLLRRTGHVVARPGPVTRLPERLRGAGVTRREYDVLAFVADGCTNTQIAERLVLSRRTVEHHVASLLRKLACENRSQLVSLSWSISAAPC